MVEAYEENGELKLTAKEFEISELKVRKLLITADVYHNDLSEMVNCLYKEGHSVKEIQMLTGLGRSSVNGYLPYTKAVYKAEELSLNAEKIGMFRRRQQGGEGLGGESVRGQALECCDCLPEVSVPYRFGLALCV